MTSLSEYLLEHEILAPAELERSRQIAEETQLRLPWALSQLGLVSEEKLLDAMHESSNLAKADAQVLDSEPADIAGLSALYLKTHKVVPVASGETIALLTSDAELSPVSDR